MLLNALMLTLALNGDADAKKRKEGEGVEVRVKVLDKASNKPVPTAMIRHPDDVETYRVNELTGEWAESQIYMPNGEILQFEPGKSLKLVVSAPGYVPRKVLYDIRRWRNHLEIKLEKMSDDDDNLEIPITPFGRDQERDPSSGGAAQ